MLFYSGSTSGKNRHCDPGGVLGKVKESVKSLLLFGSTGQLGTDLASVFTDCDLYSYGHLDIDLNFPEQIIEAIQSHQPEWIINAAAYNNVPQADVDPSPAFAINAKAVWFMAREAKKIGAKFVHFSTDYVFPGDKGEPYVESDSPRPLNCYATSKLAGEHLAKLAGQWYIFRISALFGVAGCFTKGGGNFVEAILKQAASGKPLRVVNDSFCTPTFTLDIVRYLRKNLESLKPGLYHLSNAEPCSWHEFAQEIVDQADYEIKVEAIQDTGSPVDRPRYSAIRSEKIDSLRPLA